MWQMSINVYLVQITSNYKIHKLTNLVIIYR